MIREGQSDAPKDGRAVRRQYVTPPEPRFFDQPTAAAYLGISERLFEQQWRAYQLPYPRKIGRRCVWDRKVLDHWADVVSGLAAPSDATSEMDGGSLPRKQIKKALLKSRRP